MITIIIILLVLLLLVSAAWLKTNVFEAEEPGNPMASEKLYRSTPDVDRKEKDLLDIIESHMDDVPNEEVELLKDIVEEWAEIQRNIHLDRRSWVRNPEKDFE